MTIKFASALVPFHADELPAYLNNEVRQIESAINELQTQILALDARVEALNTDLQGQIDALDARVTALETP